MPSEYEIHMQHREALVKQITQLIEPYTKGGKLIEGGHLDLATPAILALRQVLNDQLGLTTMETGYVEDIRRMVTIDMPRNVMTMIVDESDLPRLELQMRLALLAEADKPHDWWIARMAEYHQWNDVMSDDSFESNAAAASIIELALQQFMKETPSPQTGD